MNSLIYYRTARNRNKQMKTNYLKFGKNTMDSKKNETCMQNKN